MQDNDLNQLIVYLADATRRLPKGQPTDEVCSRLMAVIAYLTDKDVIPKGSWNLGPD